MNDSKSNQTLSYLDVSRIADIDKTCFDIGLNACAQDVLNTLSSFSEFHQGTDKGDKKYDSVREELIEYFSKLRVIE